MSTLYIERNGILCATGAAQGVDEHVWHASGKAKTVCTSYVLAAFSIDASAYRYSGKHHQRAGVLRRNGYAVRSRLSKLGRNRTVGKARAAIRSMGDKPGTRYMLSVSANGTRHAILLDDQGRTIVDTAPRDADRRAIVSIHAVFRP